MIFYDERRQYSMVQSTNDNIESSKIHFRVRSKL
ncbi:MAG: hypothetical protein ACI8RD_006613 [Bacillariaceae sp.]|jgi:hypothetical protein